MTLRRTRRLVGISPPVPSTISVGPVGAAGAVAAVGVGATGDGVVTVGRGAGAGAGGPAGRILFGAGALDAAPAAAP